MIINKAVIMTGCPIATITDIIEEFWLTPNGVGIQASALQCNEGKKRATEVFLKLF